jgi:hypothetical protein
VVGLSLCGGTWPRTRPQDVLRVASSPPSHLLAPRVRQQARDRPSDGVRAAPHRYGRRVRRPRCVKLRPVIRLVRHLRIARVVRP